MALVRVPGDGFWLPVSPDGWFLTPPGVADGILLDADNEEGQIIGDITIDGGGSKTFGTSSFIEWMSGTVGTLPANSTLRVGLKRGADIDETAGPAARATRGAAAFAVYRDYVGGTDTISTLTWQSSAMAAGTPFTLTQGDKIAVCWHLTVTSGSPSVNVRNWSVNIPNFPAATLITGASTYTAVLLVPNLILTADDGTFAWFPSTQVCSVAAGFSGTTVGQDNILANIVRFPFACQVDAIMTRLSFSTNAANAALEVYGTPLGTPSSLASVTHDANLSTASSSNRFLTRQFATPVTLAANTDYAIGVRQLTATGVSVVHRDVAQAGHLKSLSLGPECYAAVSTAGATFAAANSGLRRYAIYVRVCALDDGRSVQGARIWSGF